jgi:hypothetical protein
MRSQPRCSPKDRHGELQLSLVTRSAELRSLRPGMAGDARLLRHPSRLEIVMHALTRADSFFTALSLSLRGLKVPRSARCAGPFL